MLLIINKQGDVPQVVTKSAMLLCIRKKSVTISFPITTALPLPRTVHFDLPKNVCICKGWFRTTFLTYEKFLGNKEAVFRLFPSLSPPPYLSPS